MYKLLFDQNLSHRIIKEIEEVFPESNHVRLVDLEKADDFEIWEYAKDKGFHIISKDSDFNNMSSLYGHPPKVIWIRAGNINTDEIIELINKKAEIVKNFLEDKNAGLLELS